MFVSNRFRVILKLLVVLGGAVSAGGQPSADATAIVGGTIIDGSGGPPMENATLVVVAERIQAIGPAASVDVPEGARRIDATGKFVTPGFIDANVHLSLYSGWPEDRHETLVRYQFRQEELVLEAAQLHLKHGVTTVRDSYGALVPLVKVRNAIARGKSIGSRMLVAGNIVGWGGPYSVTWGLRREQGLTLFQEQMNDFLTQGTDEELMEMEPERLREAISAYLDKGPDFIKYGGTGHFSPALIGFSPRAQRVIVEETHRQGLVAETHSTTSEALRVSVLAGLDLIQHPEVLPTEIPDELVELIKERDVLCALLSNTITGEVWQEHLEEQEERKKKKAEKEKETGDFQRAEKTSAERRQEDRESGRRLEIRRRNAMKLIEAGCRVTVSTDNYLGIAPEFRREPKPARQEAGQGSIIAIEGLVELGMTPSEAIVAATKNGAMACKALADYGTLEPGKLADLLVLDANPLEDISNIRKLSLVMKEGRIVDHESLPAKPVFSTRQR